MEDRYDTCSRVMLLLINLSIQEIFKILLSKWVQVVTAMIHNYADFKKAVDTGTDDDSTSSGAVLVRSPIQGLISSSGNVYSCNKHGLMHEVGATIYFDILSRPVCFRDKLFVLLR